MMYKHESMGIETLNGPEVHEGPTCDCALAGISCRDSSNAVRGIWDFITTIFNKDGVAASHIWHIGN